MKRLTPYALAVLRIVTALIFLEHGTQKLFGFPAPPGFEQPPAFSLLWIGAMMELFGGLLVLAGFLTRPVAFLLLAYWMFHAPQNPFPALNGGDAAILCIASYFCYWRLQAPGLGALIRSNRAMISWCQTAGKAIYRCPGVSTRLFDSWRCTQ